MTPQFQSRLGTYAVTTFGGEKVRAYVPCALPPNPPVDLSDFQTLLERANQALGRLDGLSSILPDPNLIIYLYIRKEAVLSSQIEGTQSSLSDLLLYESFEAPGVPLADVEEVSRYVAAMDHGLRRLREDFPLSLRLIREIHKVLLSQGRGSEKHPGEFRTSQNWIGGTRPGNAAFVPPPHEQLVHCLGDLEKFFHLESPRMPVLLKAALAHVQFETIHPFLDGNGRVGRLLITLLLCQSGALREPILYLSLYFKTHRQRYYELLDRVRTHGDWETWVDFFLTGVKETSEQAAETTHKILSLFETDRSRIEGLGRPASSVLRVYQCLQRRPIVSIANTAGQLKLSAHTVAKAIEHLLELGIMRELTGKQRRRMFAYHRYLEILNEGTEPLLTR
ncbi:MAG: Fic family protein [Acidobacteriota bacterium]|nr:Fic family protein [Acidobacteriota bacterium]